MAIQNALVSSSNDGSIVLSTKVDTSGISEGMSKIKGKSTSLTNTFSKLGAAIASAFAIQKIIQFSNESASLATQTEASVQRLVDIYGEASGAVGNFIDQNARALGMSKSSAVSFSSVYGNLFSVWADQATNAELTNRYLNMTAVVASKTGRTVEDVQERVRSGLLGNTEAIEDLGIFVNVKTIEMTDAFQRMASGKSWEQLDAYTQQQIRSMAILEQATAKYGDEVAETTATTRARYKAAYEDFQNSWGNIVNKILIPALEALTEIFDIATKGLNAITGQSDKILGNVESTNKQTEGTADNQDELNKELKETEKRTKKVLANFDDIQILTSEIQENEENTNSNSNINLEGSGNINSTIDEISSKMATFMTVISEALIGIGLILMFMGHFGWGLGFIIGGALMLDITEAAVNEQDPTSGVSRSISLLKEVTMGALLAIGCLLIFLGHAGWGISLIVGWVIAEGYEIYQITQFSEQPIIDIIDNLKGVLGGEMIVLGIILLIYCPNKSIAISVLVEGVLQAGTEILEIAGDTTEGCVRKWVTVIKEILKDAGLVIGVILMITGANFLLGLSLVAYSATELIEDILTGTDDAMVVSEISKFETLVDLTIGGIALAIGAILLITGASPLVGLSMLATGAALVYHGSTQPSSDAAFKIIEDFINDAIFESSEFMFAAGILLCAYGNVDLGMRLLTYGAKGMAATITSSDQWNYLAQGKWREDAPDIAETMWDGVTDMLEGIEKFFSNLFGHRSNNPLDIPKLASGSVIPPNREFLAVLGDQKQGVNIEAPLQTIVDAFEIALDSRGNTNEPIREEHYYLNEQELMSIVSRLVKGGNRINGTSLVSEA